MKNVYFGISERYCFEFNAIGSDGDHVYFFVGAESKYTFFKNSKVIQTLKILKQDKFLNNTPKIKEQLCSGELWSDRGYIGAVR